MTTNSSRYIYDYFTRWQFVEQSLLLEQLILKQRIKRKIIERMKTDIMEGIKREIKKWIKTEIMEGIKWENEIANEMEKREFIFTDAVS